MSNVKSYSDDGNVITVRLKKPIGRGWMKGVKHITMVKIPEFADKPQFK